MLGVAKLQYEYSAVMSRAEVVVAVWRMRVEEHRTGAV